MGELLYITMIKVWTQGLRWLCGVWPFTKNITREPALFFSLGPSGVCPVIIYKVGGKNGFKYNPSHKWNGLRKALKLKSFKDFKILNLSILNATSFFSYGIHIFLNRFSCAQCWKETDLNDIIWLKKGLNEIKCFVCKCNTQDIKHPNERSQIWKHKISLNSFIGLLSNRLTRDN